MYDRTALRAAAEQRGDINSNRVAIRLGLSRMTAHRLWNGIGAPSAEVTAAVQEEYGLPARDLLTPAEGAA